SAGTGREAPAWTTGLPSRNSTVAQLPPLSQARKWTLPSAVTRSPAGVLHHLVDGGVIVELVLDPLQGAEGGPRVGRRVEGLVKPHQLEGEALVQAAVGELPTELVEGHAAIPGGPPGRHPFGRRRGGLGDASLVDHDEPVIEVPVIILSEHRRGSLAQTEGGAGVGREIDPRQDENGHDEAGRGKSFHATDSIIMGCRRLPAPSTPPTTLSGVTVRRGAPKARSHFGCLGSLGDAALPDGGDLRSVSDPRRHLKNYSMLNTSIHK